MSSAYRMFLFILFFHYYVLNHVYLHYSSELLWRSCFKNALSRISHIQMKILRIILFMLQFFHKETLSIEKDTGIDNTHTCCGSALNHTFTLVVSICRQNRKTRSTCRASVSFCKSMAKMGVHAPCIYNCNTWGQRTLVRYHH